VAVVLGGNNKKGRGTSKQGNAGSVAFHGKKMVVRRRGSVITYYKGIPVVEGGGGQCYQNGGGSDVFQLDWYTKNRETRGGWESRGRKKKNCTGHGFSPPKRQKNAMQGG